VAKSSTQQPGRANTALACETSVTTHVHADSVLQDVYLGYFIWKTTF